ncbi:hypothetical protein RIF25_00335 [Thermosynechococcaceae cyanobacterium BACA0444]|uniref:Uncharacterized protein n=1 Tax=Pseudocalidococcus azoricus BACA0444 TaxID=2918990 RepID=A0AAE4JXX3_9CYAN|nr:hypothetical protein [Pseudocalidococcus azoricus]MDS3859242.1 hypothetical protein [Pseudocalidococcus azoricus BACA0444]
MNSIDKNFKLVKLAIWSYFWLLIFEGAIRKWIFPGLSGPLLIIRDPVVLAIYFFAMRAGCFPKRFIMNLVLFLGFIFIILGFLQLLTNPEANLFITIFGWRVYFLHLPLIYIIPSIFTISDVKEMGKWVLLLSPVIAITMIMQFSSPPTAFINAGTMGDEVGQIVGVGNKIRPPGLFSFISGAAQFLAFSTSFMLWGLLTPKTYPKWLLLGAAISIPLALGVSTSRTSVIGCLLIFIALPIQFLLNPVSGKRIPMVFVSALTSLFFLSYIPAFSEGLDIFSQRLENVSRSYNADVGADLPSRVAEDFLGVFDVIDLVPLLGYGLGLGTNFASILITGEATFLLAEGEWARVILESGIYFGFVFILLRVLILLNMAWLSLKAAAIGNSLPLLLFLFAAPGILNGQIGQPTTLGFMVLGGGLCLAALNNMNEERYDEIKAIRVDSKAL